jgi:hypothetical protein
VAVTLGSLALMLTHRMYAELLDGTMRASDTWEQLHHEANARRLLVAVVGCADVGPTQFDAFAGTSDHVAFTTWHVDSRGLVGRRRIRLGTEAGDLVLHGLYEAPLALMSNVDGLSIDYLIQLGADAEWVRNWTSGASLPAAVRVRVAHGGYVDTLLLAVGSKG